LAFRDASRISLARKRGNAAAETHRVIRDNGDVATMLYRYRVPQPPLDAVIASIWVYQHEPAPHALERILPTGAAQLIINLKEDQTRSYDPARGFRCETASGTIVAGVSSRYGVIDTSEQEHVLGVVFRPGGTGPLLGVPADETCDRDVPLDALWGRARTAELRERLLACRDAEAQLDVMEAVMRAMWTPPGLHPAVVFALSVLDRAPHSPSIGAVTEAIGLSPKRFIDHFKAAVGVTPKRYCRIRRFQRAVTRAHQGRGVDWTQVALDCGYFDQAHFIHDFRAFAGLTPTAYEAALTPFQNHVKFLQSERAGI
jgi:AraC-like DNA-binding protein